MKTSALYLALFCSAMPMGAGAGAPKGSASAIGNAGPAFGAGAAASVLFVDASAPAGGNGLSWATAFRHLQPALDALLIDGAAADGEIWVASGVYKPTAELSPGDPRSATFNLAQGTIRIYGGFAGHEQTLSQRAAGAPGTATVLSGDLAGDDGPNFTNRDDNVSHVLTVSSPLPVLLDGFTIRGGTAQNHFDPQFSVGGAILNRKNVLDPPLMVARCTFRENEGNFGGAIFLGPFEIINCRFINNRAEANGGAVHVAGSFGLRRFTNCLFVGNQAEFGGAVSGEYGGFDLINCTVVGNYAEEFGGGVLIQGPGATCVLYNTLIWGNTLGSPSRPPSDQFWVPLSSTQFYPPSNCLVQDGMGAHNGTDILTDDPMLADPLGPDGVPGSGDEDTHPVPGSPCADAGSDGLITPDVADLDHDGDMLEPVPFDLDGRSRMFAGSVDIGAFELHGALCAGDVADPKDAVVDDKDLAVLLDSWGLCAGTRCPADIAPEGGDGVVNIYDLQLLEQDWGLCR